MTNKTKVTLKQTQECLDEYSRALKQLNKNKADDSEVSISQILESNGTSTLWATDDLCTAKYIIWSLK